jgi:hypothetical protein
MFENFRRVFPIIIPEFKEDPDVVDFLYNMPVRSYPGLIKSGKYGRNEFAQLLRDNCFFPEAIEFLSNLLKDKPK